MPDCDKQLCKRHVYICRISGAESKTHEMCAADASDPSSVLAFVKLMQLFFPSHTRSEKHLFSIKQLSKYLKSGN